MKRIAPLMGKAGNSGMRRRDFLQTAGAAAVFGLSGAGRAFATPLSGSAPASAQKTPLIDVHHHWYDMDLLRSWGRDSFDPTWTTEASLATMDEAGVSTAMLSITMPGVWKSSDVSGSIRLARSCNEGMAKAVSDHPGRFGLIAALPLPQVDASLAEIEYAFSVLKADAIGVLSSYEGQYLGDPRFAPVFAELNRRRAVVYVHPMAPSCCTGLVPAMGAGSLEAPTDTTRAIMSLLVSGTLSRLTDMQVVVGAGGGTLPFVGDRLVAGAVQAGHKAPATDQALFTPEALRAAFDRLYLDSAGITNAADWAAVMNFTTTSQLLFGTDFPFNTSASCLAQLRAMEQKFGLDAQAARAIEYGNAERLFPRRFGAKRAAAAG
jgi:predicted TIM-barrel fold metal-dependent hydrolase